MSKAARALMPALRSLPTHAQAHNDMGPYSPDLNGRGNTVASERSTTR